MARMKRAAHGRESEMLRYFRDQTSEFEEDLFRKSLRKLESEGLRADEMEHCFHSFSEAERKARFSASVRGNPVAFNDAYEDLSANEFRYVLLKEVAERRMLLLAARAVRHDDIAGPPGRWARSGGGFVLFGFGDGRLSINVHNRSWSSALASDTTENYSCIRACLVNYVEGDPSLSKLEVSINISARGRIPSISAY